MVGFLFRYNFLQEVDSGVISGMAGDYVRVKFGNYGANGFRNIRRADFVTNEHDEAYPNCAKRA